jgi:hypothetical protein
VKIIKDVFQFSRRVFLADRQNARTRAARSPQACFINFTNNKKNEATQAQGLVLFFLEAPPPGGWAAKTARKPPSSLLSCQTGLGHCPCMARELPGLMGTQNHLPGTKSTNLRQKLENTCFPKHCKNKGSSSDLSHIYIHLVFEEMLRAFPYHFFQNVVFSFLLDLLSVSLPFLCHAFRQRFFSMSTQRHISSVSFPLPLFLFHLFYVSLPFFYRFHHFRYVSLLFVVRFHSVFHRFRFHFFTVSVTISFPFPTTKRNGKEMPTAFLRTLSIYIYIHTCIRGYFCSSGSRSSSSHWVLSLVACPLKMLTFLPTPHP